MVGGWFAGCSGSTARTLCNTDVVHGGPPLCRDYWDENGAIIRRVIPGRGLRQRAQGPSRNDDLAVETTELFAAVS
jgi:hypothetical protein